MVTPSPTAVEERLLTDESFKRASTVDGWVPDTPGLYAIKVAVPDSLPEPFASLAIARGHSLIYLGKASGSLQKRFLGQELRARGHGTFFRSIGAVLGFRPQPSSLVGKANQHNYVFDLKDRQEIVDWINRHLLVSVVAVDGDIELYETALILKRRPPLNLRGNPAALPQLKALRDECLRIARTPTAL